MTHQPPFFYRSFRLLSALALSCLSATSVWGVNCDRAHWLDPEQTFQYRSIIPGQGELLSLQLPGAGVLVVEAFLSTPSIQNLALGLSGDCHDHESSKVAILERSASGLTLVVAEPGSVTLSVAARDPRAALGGYRVETRFAPLVASVQTFATALDTDESSDSRRRVTWTRFEHPRGGAVVHHVTIDPAVSWHKTEWEEVDPNPGTATASSNSWIEATWWVARPRRHKTEWEEVDPNSDTALAPKTNALVTVGAGSRGGDWDRKVVSREQTSSIPGTASTPTRRTDRRLHVEMPGIEAEMTPSSRDAVILRLLEAAALRAESAPPFLLRQLDICRPGEDDDHPDLLACARPLVLGRAVAAELAKSSCNDVDVFTFSVDRISTIEARATGEASFRTELYDRSGRLVGAPKVDGRGSRSTVRLDPGRYFVRVHGDGICDMSYRLLVTEQPSSELL